MLIVLHISCLFNVKFIECQLKNNILWVLVSLFSKKECIIWGITHHMSCIIWQNKCDEYWPKAGTTCTYGHVEITNVDEEQRADFIKRSFSIKEKGVKDTYFQSIIYY